MRFRYHYLIIKICSIFLLHVIIPIFAVESAQAENTDIKLQFSNPQSLLSQIKRYGAHRIVRNIYQLGGDQDTIWSFLIGRFQIGEPEWLDVAIALHPGTDAGYSVELKWSLGMALDKNPSAVLKRMGKINNHFFGSYICDLNALSEVSTYEMGILAADKRIQSLKEVNEAGLVTARDMCIDQLEKAKIDLKQVFKPME